MSLITPQDFKVELYIPSINETATQQNVQGLIDKYQPEFLKKLFGNDFYALFFAGLSETDGRWFDLQTDALKQALRCYVYWKWTKYNLTYTTSMGEKRGAAQNSVDASSTQKAVDRWNEMVDLNRGIYSNTDRTIYPEFYSGWFFGCGHWSPDIYNYINTLGV